jgi:hypothetical protein
MQQMQEMPLILQEMTFLIEPVMLACVLEQVRLHLVLTLVF